MQTATTSLSEIQPTVEAQSPLSWSLPFPFTLRGSLIFALVVYLLLGPARAESDIIAATLGYSFASLLLLLLIGTIWQSAKLRRKVALEINHTISIERFESGKSTKLILKLPKFSVAPGYVLTLRPRFGSDRILLPEFRLTGAASGSRYLSYTITFPHRGIWSIEQVGVTLGDQLGFTQLAWELTGESIQRRFTVQPPLNQHSSLPTISSCERPGDLLTHTQERHGDPFDIRQYHPADGARRILWKVFARRGELVSRHPEASMTPEGQVVLFSAALPDEDHVCSAMIQYAKQLRELDLGMYCGCAGMDPEGTARTPEEVEELLIDSVWHADVDETTTSRHLTLFLESIREHLRSEELKRVVLFTSPERFRSEDDVALIELLGVTLQQHRIAPVFFVITKNGFDGNFAFAELHAAQTGNLASTLRRWFTTTETTELPQRYAGYRKFLSLCARHQWDLTINGEFS